MRLSGLLFCAWIVLPLSACSANVPLAQGSDETDSIDKSSYCESPYPHFTCSLTRLSGENKLVIKIRLRVFQGLLDAFCAVRSESYPSCVSLSCCSRYLFVFAWIVLPLSGSNPLPLCTAFLDEEQKTFLVLFLER